MKLYWQKNNLWNNKKKILKKKTRIVLDKDIKESSILKRIAKIRRLKIIEIGNIVKKIKNISPEKNINFKIKNLAMAIAATKLCNPKNINLEFEKIINNKDYQDSIKDNVSRALEELSLSESSSKIAAQTVLKVLKNER